MVHLSSAALFVSRANASSPAVWTPAAPWTPTHGSSASGVLPLRPRGRREPSSASSLNLCINFCKTGVDYAGLLQNGGYVATCNARHDLRGRLGPWIASVMSLAPLTTTSYHSIVLLVHVLHSGTKTVQGRLSAQAYSLLHHRDTASQELETPVCKGPYMKIPQSFTSNVGAPESRCRHGRMHNPLHMRYGVPTTPGPHLHYLTQLAAVLPPGARGQLHTQEPQPVTPNACEALDRKDLYVPVGKVATNSIHLMLNPRTPQGTNKSFTPGHLKPLPRPTLNTQTGKSLAFRLYSILQYRMREELRR